MGAGPGDREKRFRSREIFSLFRSRDGTISGKRDCYKAERIKVFYLPPRKPQIIEIPSMNFLAVRGQGDPNEEGGAYKASIGLLYGIAYTIKMSKMGRHKIKGYFDYVVPPLEGFWRQEGTARIDYSRKKDFQWISLIRLPEFVTRDEFEWAVSEAEEKKEMDFSKVEFLTYEEGLCVQCMHIVLMTTSRRQSEVWNFMRGSRDSSWILKVGGITMRST